MAQHADNLEPDQPPSERFNDRIEMAATALMAIAAILTAWAAFQSTKWSGVQADNYSRAGAARTESSRETTIASRNVQIDVGTFLQWLDAYTDDRSAGLLAPQGGGEPYVPNPDLLSGFLATRFREEFRPAFDAWIASRPLINPDAEPTPFQLPEYTVMAEQESARLEAEADSRTQLARQANQRGDNYVMLTVLFAIALFFAGVSGKLDHRLSSSLALGAAFLVVAGAFVALLTFPVEI